MSQARSHADDAPQLGYHAGARMRVLETPAHLQPPPPPSKLHWSTLMMIAGVAIATLALLATLAGIPAKVGYDVDGAARKNKPSASDPLGLMRSLDHNMKWIAQSSADTPTTYLGLTKSINRNEAAIMAMMQAIATMDVSVRAIEAGLGDVGAATESMRSDMDAMAATSSASATAMQSLGADIGFLSQSMVDLATSTSELTKRMQSIEQQANGIAKNGTAGARKTATELNASLPEDVPVPLTDDGRPLDQVMAELAGTSGGGASAGTGTTIDAYQAGLVQ